MYFTLPLSQTARKGKTSEHFSYSIVSLALVVAVRSNHQQDYQNLSFVFVCQFNYLNQTFVPFWVQSRAKQASVDVRIVHVRLVSVPH